jgi:hypothetical protein
MHSRPIDKGEPIVWKAIIVSTLLFLLALGPLQFAQDAPTSSDNPNVERHSSMAGLVRTINTAEVTELSKYGSYAPWPILLAHNQEYFNGRLKRFYSSGDPNARFSDTPEVLPGWTLRLNVQADGKGYLQLLEDTSDKTGIAWVSDERGILRQCKYLR